MKTTKVNKDNLLLTLHENRKKHSKDYREARTVWEAKVKDRIAFVLKEVNGGIFKHAKSPLQHLPEPENFLDSYDTAIERLNWEEDATVELDETEFQQYVQNNWSWNHRFVANTSSYLAS